ncbi:MAG: insulinase family protein [Treponema sp.]|nr:insulinase family protein [Candidatus Treponema scatequi]
MKKIFLSTVIFIVSLFSVFSNPDVNEYVLENGMHAYILEDFSTALVRVEYTAKAGFSKQSINNTGFFPLYTSLFKYASPVNSEMLSSLECECNADSARYYTTITSQNVYKTLIALCNAAFNPIFPDANLDRELKECKKEVLRKIYNVEGFINGAIDSRVFSESPWKHDSGIYPKLFSNITNEKARFILKGISDKYYTPDNSALFICGPVTKEDAYKMVVNTFGKVEAARKNIISSEKIANFNSDQRLFVLSHPLFSTEMTQVVVQYTDMKMEYCDCLAEIMNNDYSAVKRNLLKQQSLGIRHAQYINFSAAHKNSSSRLIVQSLLENEIVSPCKKAQDFVRLVKSSSSDITDTDFHYAQTFLINSFKREISNSFDFMNLLSQFWAVKDYVTKDLDTESFSLCDSLFTRIQILQNIQKDKMISDFNESDPFVFVFVNSDLLEKYKKEFARAGYKIIDTKNSSWYLQQFYKELEVEGSTESSEPIDNSYVPADVFFEKQMSLINTFTLDNKIDVITQKRPSTNNVCFTVVIAGGEAIDTKEDYGLESVMIEFLWYKFNEICRDKMAENKIAFIPDSHFKTELNSSVISVECLAEDLDEIIEAFSEALIFSPVEPAIIDSFVLDTKSNQIAKVSSSAFQLFSNAVNHLIKSKDYQNVYSLNKEILPKNRITYTKVLEDYSRFLNADRFKLIVSGNICRDDESPKDFEEKYKEKFNRTFGVLSQKGKPEKAKYTVSLNSKKTKKISLVHVFMTDVPKEKAGPMPAVLIPTTEFLDPAQYWIYNAELDNTVFNAMLYDFADFLEKKCQSIEQQKKVVVRAEGATPEMPFGILTIYNVKSVSIIEKAYKEALSEYTGDGGENSIIRAKVNWTMTLFGNAFRNEGACMLLRDYCEDDTEGWGDIGGDYNKISNMNADTLKIISPIFNLDSVYKFYSADTKR